MIMSLFGLQLIVPFLQVVNRFIALRLKWRFLYEMNFVVNLLAYFVGWKWNREEKRMS